AHDVALGQHAHRPSGLVDHDEAADVVLREHHECLPDGLLGPDRDDLVTLGREDVRDRHGGLPPGAALGPGSADALDLNAIGCGPPPAAWPRPARRRRRPAAGPRRAVPTATMARTPPRSAAANAPDHRASPGS